MFTKRYLNRQEIGSSLDFDLKTIEAACEEFELCIFEHHLTLSDDTAIRIIAQRMNMHLFKTYEVDKNSGDRIVIYSGQKAVAKNC